MKCDDCHHHNGRGYCDKYEIPSPCALQGSNPNHAGPYVHGCTDEQAK